MRKDNERIGKLCATLTLGSFTDYRDEHLTHHMYLGDYARGGITLVAMALSIFLLFTVLMPLAIVVIAAILIVELMALFRSQTVVADHNNQLAEDILADL